MQVSWKWNRTNWAATSSINWNGHVRPDNLLRSQRQRVAVRRVRFIVDKTPKYRLCKRQKQVLRHVVAQLKLLLCIQACCINHKPIHGIMNTKGGLWLFGNPLYQSPSFVKNEKWPGPNRSWMNWPFPHNVHWVPLLLLWHCSIGKKCLKLPKTLIQLSWGYKQQFGFHHAPMLLERVL